MKKLWIMRHAKSDWSDTALTDYQRPLNKRGKKDAPMMGKWMASYAAIPEMIISSPARRAELTARAVAEACDYAGEDIVWWEDFYMGEVLTTLEYLKKIPGKIDHVLLIGHNPVLEELVSLLTSDNHLHIKIPTAALVLLQTYAETWRNISPGRFELQGLLTPKLIKHLKEL